jgi:putative two-component system response regulator
MSSILMVEDNVQDRALTMRVLQKLGWADDTVVVTEGESALTYLHETPSALPLLMVLDLRLPRMDGMEVLRRVRAHPRTHELPVVVLTSATRQEHADEVLQLGALACLTKPLDGQAFQAVIQQARMGAGTPPAPASTVVGCLATPPPEPPAPAETDAVPLRVLLVEDSEADARLLARELNGGGYTLSLRRVDTRHALQAALQEQSWDVILADYALPGFSGLEAVRELKASGLDIPLIIVSGQIGEERAVEALRAGAADFIGKRNLARLVPAVAREVREFKGHGLRQAAESALQSSVVQLREALEETVNALATLAEQRDPYTAGHQLRVAGLAVRIAQAMGVEAQEIEGLRVAGRLHDIGKIAVPAEILTRPGRLSAVEMAVIRTHPQAGYEILKRIPFPWPIADIVLQHQERWDGSGYPRRLAREEILPSARILAVADVIEAMASHRPYRPTLGVAQALTELRAQAGRHFDPEVVQAAVAMVDADDGVLLLG